MNSMTNHWIVWMLLLLANVLVHGQASPQKPNIVYILCDDLGYGDVQCLNPVRGKIATPSIDRLASQGITFTDAHAGSSVCTPTRYGILTGRYAWRTRLQSGVLDNYVTPLIAPDRLTVPALLKRHGYHTSCIGKWHLGFTIEGGGASKPRGAFMGAPLDAITKDGPVTRGFDYFHGFHHARMMKSVFTDDRVSALVEPANVLSLLVDRACRYIAERASGEKPFFLYLPLSSPHTPILPSRDWQGKSGLGNYADFVMETDSAVGQVLAAIDKTGIERSTLVIFTSDNGCSPAAGVAKLELQGHFPSAQMRGYKSDIWDGGHRVPFIVRWPGVVKPGSQSAQLVCLTDLLATCADLLGAKLPEDAGEDSVSILPVLKGVDHPVRQAVVHHSIHGMFAIRQDKWKLIVGAGSGGWTKGGDKGAPFQLYDMTTDQSERLNRHADEPERVKQLIGLLERYILDGRSTPGKPCRNDAPIELRKAAADDELQAGRSSRHSSTLAPAAAVVTIT